MKKSHKAFTLIEILVSIAVICILYAIIAPVVMQAKKEAKHTSDINRLGQLGRAATLYSSDTEVYVRSCAELVDAGFIKSDLCSGDLDDTREGLSNIAMSQIQHGTRQDPFIFPRKYRISFIGARDVLATVARLEKGYQGTRGWLIDVAKMQRERPGHDDPVLLGSRTGTYKRLLDSGSVVSRKSIKLSLVWNGKETQCVGDHWYFVDYSPEYLEADCKWVLGETMK